MASTTPNLGLTLITSGESVSTWGIPLNNNFSKIDLISGEILLARGSRTSIGTRFEEIEANLSGANGNTSSLNERISGAIDDDGDLLVDKFTAGPMRFGTVRMSVPSLSPFAPVAVSDNDPRMIAYPLLVNLVGKQVTSLHKHLLKDGAADLRVTADELNLLAGLDPIVTAYNLMKLLDGSVVPESVHTHPAARHDRKGLVRMSVPSGGDPVAVSSHDPRMLTTEQHYELVLGGITDLHRHKLVDSATDLTVTAGELNQLAGMGPTSTASALETLTDGSDARSLHNHNGTYYTKQETDTHISNTKVYTHSAIDAHSSSSTAHHGDNLVLGDISVRSINLFGPGMLQSFRPQGSDTRSTVKWEVKDLDGESLIRAEVGGKLHAKTLEAYDVNVGRSQTIAEDLVVGDELHVHGNTVVGSLASRDTAVFNVISALYNGDIVMAQNNGIILNGGTVDGVHVNDLYQEVYLARGRHPSLTARLLAMSDTIRDNREEFLLMNSATVLSLGTHRTDYSNPHRVTLAQAIAADTFNIGFSIEDLNTLTGQMNADSLHVHESTDAAILAIQTELNAARGTDGQTIGELIDAVTLVKASAQDVVDGIDDEKYITPLALQVARGGGGNSDITTFHRERGVAGKSYWIKVAQVDGASHSSGDGLYFKVIGGNNIYMGSRDVLEVIAGQSGPGGAEVSVIQLSETANCKVFSTRPAGSTSGDPNSYIYSIWLETDISPSEITVVQMYTPARETTMCGIMDIVPIGDGDTLPPEYQYLNELVAVAPAVNNSHRVSFIENSSNPEISPPAHEVPPPPDLSNIIHISSDVWTDPVTDSDPVWGDYESHQIGGTSALIDGTGALTIEEVLYVESENSGNFIVAQIAGVHNRELEDYHYHNEGLLLHVGQSAPSSTSQPFNRAPILMTVNGASVLEGEYALIETTGNDFQATVIIQSSLAHSDLLDLLVLENHDRVTDPLPAEVLVDGWFSIGKASSFSYSNVIYQVSTQNGGRESYVLNVTTGAEPGFISVIGSSESRVVTGFRVLGNELHVRLKYTATFGMKTTGHLVRILDAGRCGTNRGMVSAGWSSAGGDADTDSLCYIDLTHLPTGQSFAISTAGIQDSAGGGGIAGGSNVTVSTGYPTGGSDGDIWIVVE